MSAGTHYNLEAAMQQCVQIIESRAESVKRWKEEADRLDELGATSADWDERVKARAGARALRRDIAKVEGGEMEDFLLEVMPIYERYQRTFKRPKHKAPKHAKKRVRFDMSAPVAPSDDNANRGGLFREFIQKVQKYHFLSDVVDSAQLNGGDDANRELYAFCPSCNTNMIENTREALLVCSTCGDTAPVCGDTERNVPYGTSVCTTDYCYKRINHFNETLAQFHAREKSVIPQDVIDALSLEFKKARIVDSSTLTPCIVRKFLRKMRLSKYFEHSVQITQMFNGTSPPNMTTAQEEKLRNMFRQVQEPFEQVVPKGRKNFLNYSYCIHKMCQLLEYDEFLPHFPLLKSKEKLWEQDDIWKNICHRLNWQFIPSK